MSVRYVVPAGTCLWMVIRIWSETSQTIPNLRIKSINKGIANQVGISRVRLELNLISDSDYREQKANYIFVRSACVCLLVFLLLNVSVIEATLTCVCMLLYPQYNICMQFNENNSNGIFNNFCALILLLFFVGVYLEKSTRQLEVMKTIVIVLQNVDAKIFVFSWLFD